jgi:hypothetical protein
LKLSAKSLLQNEVHSYTNDKHYELLRMSVTFSGISHKGQWMISSAANATHTAKISLHIMLLVSFFFSLPKGDPTEVKQNAVMLYEAKKFPFVTIRNQINKVPVCRQSLLVT